MKKRHTDLTPTQVQNRLFNRFCFTIILSWVLMTLIFRSTPTVESNNIQEQVDENLTNKKPTDRWRLNSNWYSQKYVYLTWNTRDDRSIQLLNAYWFDWVDVWSSIKTIARIWRVQPEIIVCISYADSSLGKHLKTANNRGNVGNNDRGDTQSYETLEQWFNAIGKVLNNKYLSYIYTIDYLSRYKNTTGTVYATSNENHFINTYNCLSMIHDKKLPENWNFRR